MADAAAGHCGVLRIHFTPQDLMRTRFVAEPAPLAELVIALMVLRRGDADLFDHWRHGARRVFPRESLPLFDLVLPDRGPDFLDSLRGDFEGGLDEVLSAPRREVRLALRTLESADHPVAGWVRDLADGDRAAQRVLEVALRGAHEALVRRTWPRVAGSFHADLARRRELVLAQGIGAALTTLHPTARWNGSTLEIAAGGHRDVRLRGDGLTLMPTAFLASVRPLVGRAVPGRARLLVYPARIPLPLITAGDAGADLPLSVAALLGRTRAAVLEAIATNPAASTGELARRLGISSGRASEHATVLRQAGLINSHRHRNTVLHAPTPLGADLLNGATARR
ncbi:winged helix-turn-helix transcriptional regulator [Solihabitans fulvus]|uniref:Winged helix-turn-helix transcriptional regulator n=1 Tax=Solihabitans fulvus TaxID=1892852 RepID=A0A5B2WT51_9PSEU|nr:helix-turn-helix domain-containing protein [Solihabitans fulvus]KAA2253892.1 winged helix-turn-helix transcriptional regulator [Solihabitans fulvus]